MGSGILGRVIPCSLAPNATFLSVSQSTLFSLPYLPKRGSSLRGREVVGEGVPPGIPQRGRQVRLQVGRPVSMWVKLGAGGGEGAGGRTEAPLVRKDEARAARLWVGLLTLPFLGSLRQHTIPLELREG